ncbi:hypothetical protein [Marinobacterium sp. BA1]|uniref:hypothetical protein n=1 Tax=Marinobacterium sp. BA1 TaxID=3138931 RepID=UPI0032E792E2
MVEFDELLLVRADALENIAHTSFSQDDLERGDSLMEQVTALWAENESRMMAAKEGLAAVPEECQDSGLENAGQTFKDRGWNKRIAEQSLGEMVRFCEYWELAHDTALSAADLLSQGNHSTLPDISM